MQFAAGILMFLIISWLVGAAVFAIIGRQEDEGESLLLGIGIMIGLIFLVLFLANR